MHATTNFFMYLSDVTKQQLTTWFLKNYSLLRDFTGLVIAAFMAW